MSPRAERNSSSQEEDLTPVERKQLTVAISSLLAGDKLGIMMDPRLEKHVPYILLNRLAQLRQDPDISSVQKDQLGKMIALGVKQIPAELPPGVQNLDEFLDFLATEIPEEISAAAEFPDNLKGLPAPWKKALTDWRKAESSLLGKK